MHPRIDRCDINGAAGLKKDGIAGIAKSGHEWKTIGLGKRFSSGDLYEPASVGLYLSKGFLDRALMPPVKCIVSITPGAAERASGQSNKHTELSDVARLTLDAMEDLGDAHDSRGER
jgi:hypothetical protein